MELTQEEDKLLRKYLDTKDNDILEHIIKHPWAYSVPMVQVAIGLICVVLAPQRFSCWNTITLSEEK